MIVRRATTDDAAALLALIEQYWEFEGLAGFRPDAVRAPLQRLLSSPEVGAAWLAADGQQPLGYVILVYVFSLEHHGMTAEIDEFFVVANYRGSGVGSQLLRVAEAESVRQGCTNLSLQVSTSNHRAKKFYRQRGYSPRSEFELLEKSLGGV